MCSLSHKERIHLLPSLCRRPVIDQSRRSEFGCIGHGHTGASRRSDLGWIGHGHPRAAPVPAGVDPSQSSSQSCSSPTPPRAVRAGGAVSDGSATHCQQMCLKKLDKYTLIAVHRYWGETPVQLAPRGCAMLHHHRVGLGQLLPNTALWYGASLSIVNVCLFV